MVMLLIKEDETVDFRNFVMDAPSTGLFYSWNNKSLGNDRMSSRIDKSFVSCNWNHKL